MVKSPKRKELWFGLVLDVNTECSMTWKPFAAMPRLLYVALTIARYDKRRMDSGERPHGGNIDAVVETHDGVKRGAIGPLC